MQVVYTGSVRRVFVPQLRGVEVERGVPIEVPDAVGLQLIEQRTWSRFEDPKPNPKPAAKKSDEKPAARKSDDASE